MKLVRRAEWGALPPKSLPGPQARRLGVVVHYTGASGRYAKADHAGCDDQVRAIQRSHQAIPEQSDIEYQALVCVHGYVFEGRVYGQKGGANGTASANADYSSVCALVGVDDALTDELLDGIEDAAAWLEAGPEWKGHRDVKATGCPGDRLYAWTKGRHPWRAASLPSGSPIVAKTTTTAAKAIAYAESIGCDMAHAKPVAETYWMLHALGHPVRPDVAFAQAILETARFRFGRMIDARYHNPSGCRTAVIFAGEGEVPCNHERFADWADGCMAHLDHLALYAGADGYPRKGRTRDPRHFPYLHGTCRTVEALGVWTGRTDNHAYGAAVRRHMDGMGA